MVKLIKINWQTSILHEYFTSFCQCVYNGYIFDANRAVGLQLRYTGSLVPQYGPIWLHRVITTDMEFNFPAVWLMLFQHYFSQDVKT